MKKIKFCLAAAVLATTLLSGCGMARDGYIEDLPAQTPTPVETPFVTSTPRPTKKPASDASTGEKTVEETPLPDDAQQTTTPNM